MRSPRNSIRRLALLAMLTAVYITVSTLLVIPLGPLKITFEALPVVICAVAFGPLDALAVGFLGEFINQMLTYGFTPTTLLWVAPIAFRGISIGLCARLFPRQLGAEALIKRKQHVLFWIVCVLAAMAHTCINTLAYYADSKMFGYYRYELVFGVFWTRIASSVVSALIMAIATVPVLAALKKAGFLPKSTAGFRSAEDAIAYIHSVSWKSSAPGLSRTRELLKRMGNPQKNLKFVHIAGTNGKGSTAAMTASILRKAGYKTGLFTSPYIYRFQERMQVNGAEISNEDLCAVTDFVRGCTRGMAEPPTEFELVTCIGLEYFARMGCDIVVLEVGMGGAMDSTNVIDCPEVAVITNIGLDHTEHLGSTLEEIAQTKAGIFKENGTAVIYRSAPGVETVLEQICQQRNVTLKKADFAGLHLSSASLDEQVFDCGSRKALHLPLLGTHQLHNAAVVLSVMDVLMEKGWKITEDHIREGLRDVRWPGRFDILRREPLFILDGGHNPQCIEALVDNIRDYLEGKTVIALTGVLADKDYADMFRPVMGLVHTFVCITPPSPRCLSAETLAAHLRDAGADAQSRDTIRDGVAAALELAGKDGAVLCFGSLYSIGAIRDALDTL